jgi:hypothetical protein
MNIPQKIYQQQKMINKLFTIKALLLTMCFLGSCFNKREESVNSLEGIATNSEKLPQEITRLIEKCVKCGCHWRFNKDHSNKDILIRYSKVYFSPDSTKLFLIMVHQINGVQNKANSKVDFEIRGDAFIGYKNEEWNLYLYHSMMPVGYFSYLEVEEMIDFFEGENFRLKSSVYFYDSINDLKWISSNMVGPNDPKFWDSQLWQKNIEIRGLYPFQIVRYKDVTDVERSVNELLIEVENCR